MHPSDTLEENKCVIFEYICNENPFIGVFCACPLFKRPVVFTGIENN